jgi:hypothetical protein
MIAKNSEYDGFCHVHLATILKCNNSSVGTVDIIKASIDCSVKKEATCSGEFYSPFQIFVSWRKKNGWERA